MKPKRSVFVQFSPADQEQMVEFLRKGKQSVGVVKVNLLHAVRLSKKEFRDVWQEAGWRRPYAETLSAVQQLLPDRPSINDWTAIN